MSSQLLQILAFVLVCMRINVRCQGRFPPADNLPADRPVENRPAAVFNLPSGFEEILTDPLQEGFTCEGKQYGYYTDVNNNCQVFHVCHPMEHSDGRLEVLSYTFFCPNQTVFDQSRLACVFASPGFDCAASEAYADEVNSRFGEIPEENENRFEDAETVLREDTITSELNEEAAEESQINFLKIANKPGASFRF